MGMVGNLLGGMGGSGGNGGGMAGLGAMLNGMMGGKGGRGTGGKGREPEKGGGMGGLGGMLNGLMGGKGGRGMGGKEKEPGKGGGMPALGGMLNGLLGGKGGGRNERINRRRMGFPFSRPNQEVHCEKIDDLFDVLKNLDFATITPSNLSSLIEEHCACSSRSHLRHGNGTTSEVGEGDDKEDRSGMGGDGMGRRMGAGRVGGRMGGAGRKTIWGGGNTGGDTCPPCECEGKDSGESEANIAMDEDQGGFNLFDALAG